MHIMCLSRPKTKEAHFCCKIKKVTATFFISFWLFSSQFCIYISQKKPEWWDKLWFYFLSHGEIFSANCCISGWLCDIMILCWSVAYLLWALTGLHVYACKICHWGEQSPIKTRIYPFIPVLVCTLYLYCSIREGLVHPPQSFSRAAER